MKKQLLLLAAAMFMLGSTLSAQYNNTTLNGPWIVNGEVIVYLTFDGAGHILNIGYAIDTTQGPIGTYSVTADDSLHATINGIGGQLNLVGIVTTDSTINFRMNGNPGSYMIKVQHPGALADTLTGNLYDSVSQVNTPVQFIINGAGAITQATPFPGVVGNFYADSGFCAGFMATTDTNCILARIQISGHYSNNVITADCFFGLLTDTTCQPHYGSAVLTRTGAGASAVNNVAAQNQFAIYPNPGKSYAVVTGLTAGNNYNITITDLTGRAVMQQLSTGAVSTTLNMQDITPGMYLIRIAEGARVETLKFIKE